MAKRGWMLAVLLLAARAVSAAPLPPGVADSLLIQARRAHWAGDEASAIPVFERYLESNPRDRSVRLDLANAFAWSGNPERALPLYRDLLASDPVDPALLRAHADCLRWAGRVEESLDAYRILPEPPQEPEVRREIERLRRTLDPAGFGESFHFSDSGDLTADLHQLAWRLLGGSARSLSLGLGMQRMREERIGVKRATPWGRSLVLQAASELGPGRSLRIEAGGIGYADGPGHPRIAARLRSMLLRSVPLEIRAAYRDRAFDLRSVRAHERRIEGLDGSLAGYVSIGHAGGAYARLRAGRYSDGNDFRGADLSCDAAIHGGLRAAVSGSGTDHARGSDDYYAAREEWTLAGHLILDRVVSGSHHLRLDGWAGRIGNIYGDGDVAGVRCDYTGPLAGAIWLRLAGELGQSRQRSSYESRQLTIAADWRP